MDKTTQIFKQIVLVAGNLIVLPTAGDSVFGKRVLTYLGNRGIPDYSQMNVFMAGIGNYIFLEREKSHLSENV